MSDWPASVPREEMLARVMRRGRYLRRLRRLAFAAASALVAAASVMGYQFATSGAADGPRDGTIDEGAGPVEYHACPGTGAVGRFEPGDPVQVTGVDPTGDWLQVRSPVEAAERVWVPAADVTTEAAPDGPVVDDCDPDGDGTPPSTDGALTTTTTEGTTVPDDETTTTGSDPTVSDPTLPRPPSTTRPGPAPTTAPGPGATSPTSTSAPTPTSVVDATGPVIRSVSRQHSTLYEDHHPGFGCPAGSPTSGWIRAEIADPESGVASATMTWTVRDVDDQVIHQGSRSMHRISGSTSDGTWQATLGPFLGDVLPGMSVHPGRITVQVTAVNGDGGAGSPATRVDFVTLRDCTFG